MKSTIIFAAVVAASITPAMAGFDWEGLDQEVRRMKIERRLDQQEQQLRRLQGERDLERIKKRSLIGY